MLQANATVKCIGNDQMIIQSEVCSHFYEHSFLEYDYLFFIILCSSLNKNKEEQKLSNFYEISWQIIHQALEKQMSGQP